MVKEAQEDLEEEPHEVPSPIQPLLTTFANLTPQEHPTWLPPMHNIQHVIDLVPSVTLLNLPHVQVKPISTKSYNAK